MSWRVAVAVVAVVALVVGLALFEPWRLFTSSRVDEAVPTALADPARRVARRPTWRRLPSRPTRPSRCELALGDFEDAEHDTSGTARVLELADGRRFVRLEDLASSDGPDLHVWLSDAPSGGEWGSYDDGSYVRLGELKATHGNQNYEIPADARHRPACGRS